MCAIPQWVSASLNAIPIVETYYGVTSKRNRQSSNPREHSCMCVLSAMLDHVRHINTEKASLPVGVRRSKTPLTPFKSPNGDQHQFSPNDISILSIDMVMRILIK